MIDWLIDRSQVKDLQLEMEEMHDQFRDEETAEFRELQRELEATAKACRIVNFKLRKTERRCEQLEVERVQAEEKARLLEARFRTTDDRQHIMELEEELRMAKVSWRSRVFWTCQSFRADKLQDVRSAQHIFSRNHHCWRGLWRRLAVRITKRVASQYLENVQY